MNLITERFTINEVSNKDIIDIHNLYSLKEVDEFNTSGVPASLEETGQQLDIYLSDQTAIKRKNFCWTIRKIESLEFVGCIGMNVFADRFKLAKIFFYLRPEFWGKGYATESAKEIIKFGLTRLSLHRIEAGAAADNIRSLKVLEKCGMKSEGIRRRLLPYNGEWKDCVHYSILESDKRNY